MKNETEFPLRCVGTFKIKDTVHSGPIKRLITAVYNRVSKLNTHYVQGHKFNKNESEVAPKVVWMNPEFAHKLTLNLKMKRESLQLKIFDR